jgi:hypothetical protein
MERNNFPLSAPPELLALLVDHEAEESELFQKSLDAMNQPFGFFAKVDPSIKTEDSEEAPIAALETLFSNRQLPPEYRPAALAGAGYRRPDFLEYFDELAKSADRLPTGSDWDESFETSAPLAKRAKKLRYEKVTIDGNIWSKGFDESGEWVSMMLVYDSSED